jgi:Hypervirulence associated proteins TUDOR domain
VQREITCERASKDEPQYQVRSDKGADAAHKPGALRLAAGRRAEAGEPTVSGKFAVTRRQVG